jgi:hypothetical protein
MTILLAVLQSSSRSSIGWIIFLIVVVVIPCLAVVTFALHTKEYVKAGFSLRPFGFVLEAKQKCTVTRRKRTGPTGTT